jgi:hypothetical protein
MCRDVFELQTAFTEAEDEGGTAVLLQERQNETPEDADAV